MEKSAQGKIYYIIPDIHKNNFNPLDLLRALKRLRLREHIKRSWFVQEKPVGGIKVIYQHCEILNSLGLKAYPLKMGQYEGNFFNYQHKICSVDDIGFELGKNDIVICPEFIPYVALQFKQARKFLFAQTQTPYQTLLPKHKHMALTELGYEGIICCSQHLFSYLEREPEERLFLVDNFINHKKFCEDAEARVPNRVLALPRKHPQDIKQIMAYCRDIDVEFRLVDNVDEDTIIQEYQRADIFLATGYPEGFGLPPLEAMACGAAVVGFTGGGANAFMLDNTTALTSADGDCAGAAENIKSLVSNQDLKEAVRKAGKNISQQYQRRNAQKQLTHFLQAIDFSQGDLTE